MISLASSYASGLRAGHDRRLGAHASVLLHGAYQRADKVSIMSGASGASSSGRPLRTQPAASSALLKKKGMSLSDLTVQSK